MAERALPQASRKNALRVFADLLRPGARESFSTAALAEAGYGQGRHAHALLTFLGFLDGDRPTEEVRQRRGDVREFAAYLRRAVCQRYAPRLGDMDFVFDETNQETVRSLAKARVERASQAAARPLLKRNIAQVVDCLLAVREVYRQLQSGRCEWMVKALPEETDGRRQAADDRGQTPVGVDAGTPEDLLSRLAGRLSTSTRRISFHAKHVHIDDAGHGKFTLDDVNITID
jgi:hypothetical protein